MSAGCRRSGSPHQGHALQTRITRSLWHREYAAEDRRLLYTCTRRTSSIALGCGSDAKRVARRPQVSDAGSLIRRHVAAELLWVARRGGRTACAARIIEGTMDALIEIDASREGAALISRDLASQDIEAGMGRDPPGSVSINSTAAGRKRDHRRRASGARRAGRWAPSGVILGLTQDRKARWAWDMMHPDMSGIPPRGRPGFAEAQ